MISLDSQFVSDLNQVDLHRCGTFPYSCNAKELDCIANPVFKNYLVLLQNLFEFEALQETNFAFTKALSNIDNLARGLDQRIDSGDVLPKGDVDSAVFQAVQEFEHLSRFPFFEVNRKHFVQAVGESILSNTLYRHKAYNPLNMVAFQSHTLLYLEPIIWMYLQIHGVRLSMKIQRSISEFLTYIQFADDCLDLSRDLKAGTSTPITQLFKDGARGDTNEMSRIVIGDVRASAENLITGAIAGLSSSHRATRCALIDFKDEWFVFNLNLFAGRNPGETLIFPDAIEYNDGSVRPIFFY